MHHHPLKLDDLEHPWEFVGQSARQAASHCWCFIFRSKQLPNAVCLAITQREATCRRKSPNLNAYIAGRMGPQKSIAAMLVGDIACRIV
jgi:hypothetical protein